MIFLQPFRERLLEAFGTDFDIMCQDDSCAGLCTGFFIARKSDLLIRLFEEMIDFMKENKVGDQRAFRPPGQNPRTMKN
jgi:hypothetical protein